MATPKWTEERTNQLTNIVGSETPVSLETVAAAAEALETSERSVASKLRKMGVEVAVKSAAPSKFSDAVTAQLVELLNNNPNAFTYGEAAEALGGDFSAKQVQGKVLSLELTGLIKPTEKVVAALKYTPEEEAQIISMVEDGCFLEAIADALNRPLASIRGKMLSLLQQERIDSIPKQEVSTAKPKADAMEGLDLANFTVTTLAETIGKTERGVRTMLTRRGLSVSDYDGAAKKAKREAAAEAA